MKIFEDVEAFHKKYGLEYDGKPRAVPMELAQLRHTMAVEEADEWNRENRRACFSGDDQADYTYHLSEALDALVDQMYVLVGSIYISGMYPLFGEAWDRVHEKNMQKVRAARAGDSKRGSAFDVVKPVGWTPPDHSDLVEDNDRS